MNFAKIESKSCWLILLNIPNQVALEFKSVVAKSDMGSWWATRRAAYGESTRPRQEMPNLEDPFWLGFDDFPDVDGWGFGSA
jgi:hypothetical protein